MIRRSKRGALTLALAGVLALGAAVPSVASASSKPPILIGFSNPLTGDEAAFGQSDLHAIQLAVADVNASGGLLGRKVKLVLYDNKGDPATGVAGANYFVSQKVAAVVGFFNSDITLPASVILHRAGIPLVTDASTVPKLTEQGFQNVFRVIGTNSVEAKVAAQFARTVLRAKTAVVLNDEESYGEDIASDFAADFRADGGRVVAEDGVQQNQIDFRSLLTQIKAEKPDVVFFGGFYTAAGTMVKQAAELGLHTHWLQDGATYSPTYISIAGKAAVGTYAASEPSPETLAASDPVARRFVREYVSRFGSQPTEYATYCYDAASVIFAAIRKEHSADPAAIIKGLHSLRNFPGVTGPITFDRTGQNSAAFDVINVVTKDRTWKVAWQPTH